MMKSNLTGRVRIGECIKCGNCCRVPDWKEDLESDRTLQIMAKFGADTDAILKLLKGHNKCPQLDDNNMCKAFASRDATCRNYPANEWELSYHSCCGYEFVENGDIDVKQRMAKV